MDLILTLAIHSLIVALLIAHRMDLFKEVKDIFNIFVTGTSPTVGAFLADGTYSDSKGRKVGTVDDGQWKWTTHSPTITTGFGAAPEPFNSEHWAQQPEIQKQLREMKNLFRREVIRAIYEDRTPPESIKLHGIGIHTRETLRNDWNDEWQALANEMGIKLFQKRTTAGSPNPNVWVDARPGTELKFKTSFPSMGNTITVVQTADSTWTFGGPPH